MKLYGFVVVCSSRDCIREPTKVSFSSIFYPEFRDYVKILACFIGKNVFG